MSLSRRLVSYVERNDKFILLSWALAAILCAYPASRFVFMCTVALKPPDGSPAHVANMEIGKHFPSHGSETATLLLVIKSTDHRAITEHALSNITKSVTSICLSTRPRIVGELSSLTQLTRQGIPLEVLRNTFVSQNEKARRMASV